MTLHIIGLGLWNQKDISVRGLEIVRSCDAVYLEEYTSLLACSHSELEEFYGKEIILADRAHSEQKVNEIINLAKEKDVAFLVIGDPVSATTHMEIVRSCMEKKVSVSIVHNASIFSAIGITGLQPYKFGKTISIPFLERVPNLETPYHMIKQNLSIGTHTLCLLDIMVDNVAAETGGKVADDAQNTKFMTVPEGLAVLEDIESRLKEGVIKEDTFVVGVARLGHDDFVVKAGKLSVVKEFDFGGPLHSLVIPGKLHFSEEEMLQLWSDQK
ncbi:diphthine synthase [archaeon]|nr:diphthine synthase [archaeon]|tara:strand:- start:4797 stop:5609 length:813 start_codon:yes stop_codon:yes gene_type:complete